MKHLLKVAAVLLFAKVGMAQVCFYEHINYGGAAFCLNAGQQNANLRGAWNDRISSIYVPQGMHTRVCENANFSGRCLNVRRSLTDLRNQNFNDVISSVAVNYAGGGQPNPPPYNPPPYQPPYQPPYNPGPQGQEACFFTGENFVGQPFCVRPGTNYDNLDNTGLNDRLNSVRMPYGANVYVCDNAGFRPPCTTFSGSVASFGMYNFSNRISSIRY